MNIFKALSEGNGKISETNVTSFMSYLLDSSNELNNAFFVLFLNLIDKSLETDNLFDLLDLKKNSIREQIISFSNEYVVTSEPEYTIIIENGRKQIPDILLRISSKNEGEDLAYIIIENKISKHALKKGQIEKQYNYFKRSEDFDKSKPIYSLLITPDDNAFERLIVKAEETNSKTVWLKWTNHIEKEQSIEASLRKLIKYEQNAEIEPIDPNTQFIIKSFIDYIATEFSYRESGKRNMSFKGFDEVGKAYAEIRESIYYIKRFSNNMIRIFDKNDNLMEIEVMPILKEINKKYNLRINLNHPTGYAKNTQVLGKDIINGLKEREKIPVTLVEK